MYMSTLGKPTDQDLDQYPHVLLTSPHEWIPLSWIMHIATHMDTILGHVTLQLWTNMIPRIDEYGNINCRIIHTLSILSDTPITSIQKHIQQPTTIDYNKFKCYFGWVNAYTVEKTFQTSTQWAVTSTRFPMRKHFETQFPAFNIPCRNETVATDTIFSDTPAIDSGVTMAQIYIGKDSLVSDVYPMQSQHQI